MAVPRLEVIHVDRDTLGFLQEVMELEYPLLLETFLGDLGARLQQLRDARDAEALGQAAHSLKGSSSNMGAVHLAELCRTMEGEVYQLSPAAIEELLSEIAEEIALVEQLYKAEHFSALHRE